VRDFNLSPVDRSCSQKFNKENLEQNDIIDLMDLRDIYRIVYPATAQYTYFSAIHKTFSKIDHILRHNTYLNK
jgi:exonuclease III